MKYEDLRRVMAALGVSDLPPPNHAEWSHCACPFAPWKHRGGIDRSRGFALKSETPGASSYSCPACKSSGRIENLVRELGRLRGEDYSALLADVQKIELSSGMMLPPWEDRLSAARIETLPDPLDPVAFDPEMIFDDVETSPQAVQYLLDRRVSRAAVDKIGMRFDPDKKRLVFPVYTEDGSLYGFTGRTILPPDQLTYISPETGQSVQLPKVLDYANLPKRLLILGEHRWKKGRPTVIVEGLFAYARFLTEGVDDHFNVGALQGSELTPGKAAILRRWGLPVYLILDPDEAGDAGTFGKMKRIGVDRETGEPIQERDVTTGAVMQLVDHVPVYVPAYPQGISDPDDLSLENIMTMCRDCPVQFKPKVKKNRLTHN